MLKANKNGGMKMGEKDMEKNMSITITVALAPYENVKVTLGKVVNSEDYEKVENEIMDAMESILPDAADRAKRLLDEYKKVH